MMGQDLVVLPGSFGGERPSLCSLEVRPCGDVNLLTVNQPGCPRLRSAGVVPGGDPPSGLQRLPAGCVLTWPLLCVQRGPGGGLRVSLLLTGTPVLLDRGPTLMTSLNLLTS